jgi:membrane protein implicated in regulation of membrane protease activity
MSAQIIWWILAFVLVAAELTTGTFYLLVYGLAASGGALVAWLGGGLFSQLLVAAMIGLAGTLALRRFRARKASDAVLLDLDIGQPVSLESWQDMQGIVRYRGTQWQARAESAAFDRQRPLFIRAVHGSTLIIGN